MERRRQGSGQVTAKACPTCRAEVTLDPALIEARPGSPSLPCPACGGLVPVRYSDQHRLPLAPAGQNGSPAQAVPAQAVPAQAVPAQAVPAQAVPAQAGAQPHQAPAKRGDPPQKARRRRTGNRVRRTRVGTRRVLAGLAGAAASTFTRAVNGSVAPVARARRRAGERRRRRVAADEQDRAVVGDWMQEVVATFDRTESRQAGGPNRKV